MIRDHPWNLIHQADAYPAEELVPGFFEAVRLFQAHGCRLVLDLGCGNGRYTAAMEQEGLAVVGLDIAPAGLAKTRQKLDAVSRPVRLALADFHAPLPFRDGCFDAVYSTQVIHHARLAQVRDVIAEIRRVLVPDGWVFASVSGRQDGEEGSFEDVEPGTCVPLTGLEAGVPHHIFTVKTAAEAFAAFQILDISLRDNGRVIVIQVQKG